MVWRLTVTRKIFGCVCHIPKQYPNNSKKPKSLSRISRREELWERIFLIHMYFASYLPQEDGGCNNPRHKSDSNTPWLSTDRPTWYGTCQLFNQPCSRYRHVRLRLLPRSPPSPQASLRPPSLTPPPICVGKIEWGLRQ